jgi:hypothetical protein
MVRETDIEGERRGKGNGKRKAASLQHLESRKMQSRKCQSIERTDAIIGSE